MIARALLLRTSRTAARTARAASTSAPKFNKTSFREPDPSKPRLVLAYSGGLDTSCQLSWLAKEKGFEVRRHDTASHHGMIVLVLRLFPSLSLVAGGCCSMSMSRFASFFVSVCLCFLVSLSSLLAIATRERWRDETEMIELVAHDEAVHTIEIQIEIHRSSLLTSSRVIIIIVIIIRLTFLACSSSLPHTLNAHTPRAI
jgi:hypothetical protein